MHTSESWKAYLFSLFSTQIDGLVSLLSCGGSCHLEVAPVSEDFSQLSDIVSVSRCELREVSRLICWNTLVRKSCFPECFTQPSGLWKEIGWKETQLTCASLSPRPEYHLSASLALRSSSLLEDGAEYRHFSSFSEGERFVVCCRSSSVHMNWKCSFVGHSAFVCLFVFSFLLAAVLYYTFLHSQSGPGSWCISFHKEVLSSCSCERCLGAMILFTQRFCGDILACFAAPNTAEAALHYIAMQVWTSHCFGCRRGAWLTAVFLTTCLHFFSQDIYRSLFCWAERNGFVQLMWHAS